MQLNGISRSTLFRHPEHLRDNGCLMQSGLVSCSLARQSSRKRFVNLRARRDCRYLYSLLGSLGPKVSEIRFVATEASFGEFRFLKPKGLRH